MHAAMEHNKALVWVLSSAEKNHCNTLAIHFLLHIIITSHYIWK